MLLRDLDLPEVSHVYPLREDSMLLASSSTVRAGERVLELGCGLGLSAISAARAGGHVVATDVNPYALRALQKEAERRELAIGTIRTDLFRGLGRFDVVLCNPPYLPTPRADHDPDPWMDHALDGGEDGLSFVRRFLRELPDHLTVAGRAYLLVASTVAGPVRTRGLPTKAPGIEVVDLVGDRVLPAETLWVLELRATG